MDLILATTLGRELLLLASHTVRQVTVFGQYCRAAGREFSQNFGKAPATIAFERAHAAIGLFACV